MVAFARPNWARPCIVKYWLQPGNDKGGRSSAEILVPFRHLHRVALLHLPFATTTFLDRHPHRLLTVTLY